VLDEQGKSEEEKALLPVVVEVRMAKVGHWMRSRGM
jgi:hypothetical protein